MKINEITINEKEQFLNTIKNVLAIEIKEIHDDLSIRSNQFTIDMIDVASPEIIELIVERIKEMQECNVFDSNDQAFKVLEFLLQYTEKHY